jgi:hypothetical protein
MKLAHSALPIVLTLAALSLAAESSPHSMKSSMDLGGVVRVEGDINAPVSVAISLLALASYTTHSTFPRSYSSCAFFMATTESREHCTPLVTFSVSDEQVECWFAFQGSHCLELSSHFRLDPAPQSARKFDGDAVEVQRIATSRTGRKSKP